MPLDFFFFFFFLAWCLSFAHTLSPAGHVGSEMLVCYMIVPVSCLVIVNGCRMNAGSQNWRIWQASPFLMRVMCMCVEEGRFFFFSGEVEANNSHPAM